MMETLDGIRKQLSELVEYAFREGYDACNEDVVKSMRECGFTSPEEAYQKGLDDAWEAARKIVCKPGECGGLESIVLDDIFEIDTDYDILRNCTASEAIAKIKAYEEQKKAEEEEVKVGDEVIGKFGFFRGVVVGIDLPSQKASVLNVGYTLPQTYSLNCIDRTTGRHFPQIAEVLKQLQEGEE